MYPIIHSSCFPYRAPGPPPEKVVGVGLEGPNTFQGYGWSPRVLKNSRKTRLHPCSAVDVGAIRRRHQEVHRVTPSPGHRSIRSSMPWGHSFRVAKGLHGEVGSDGWVGAGV